MTAEREALRMGIERLTVLFPTTVQNKQHIPARPSNKLGGKHSLFNNFPEERIVIHASAQRSRELHAEGILNVEKAGYHKEQSLGHSYSRSQKVFKEENGSRLQHRYAVVVQDFTTQ